MNIKSECNHCNGRIEFDGSDLGQGETRTIECPHCHLETTIFVPFKTDEEADAPEWFGSAESTVQMRLGSGDWLRVKSVRLYRESHVQYLVTQKSQVAELVKADFPGAPALTSQAWVMAYGALVRAMESQLPAETFERATRLMDEIGSQEAALLERGIFHPVGQIKYIEHPQPSLWRVTAGSAAYIHPEFDFVNVTDTEGVTCSVRWKSVEHYLYAQS